MSQKGVDIHFSSLPLAHCKCTRPKNSTNETKRLGGTFYSRMCLGGGGWPGQRGHGRVPAEPPPPRLQRREGGRHTGLPGRVFY